jgi:hypothetical protein
MNPVFSAVFVLNTPCDPCGKVPREVLVLHHPNRGKGHVCKPCLGEALKAGLFGTAPPPTRERMEIILREWV